jgi:hypothetical protein
LGGILVGASLLKIASPGPSRAAFSTFGIRDERSRKVLWVALIVTELGLAAGVVGGLDAAAWSAAALMTAFAVVLATGMLRGRSGAPCACFGSRSTVSWTAVARNLALAAAFAAVPFLPQDNLSTDQWLALGLGVALLACAGLIVAMLALAREVGMLRLRLQPDSALEIPEEGPELGSRTELIDRIVIEPEADMALAVFVSEDCRVCRSLQPSIASLAREPLLAVNTFEEVEDADVWQALDVPGSPFAVALDLDGAVLAKGTFNNLAQLESVIATADRRRAAQSLMESRAGG